MQRRKKGTKEGKVDARDRRSVIFFIRFCGTQGTIPHCTIGCVSLVYERLMEQIFPLNLVRGFTTSKVKKSLILKQRVFGNALMSFQKLNYVFTRLEQSKSRYINVLIHDILIAINY